MDWFTDIIQTSFLLSSLPPPETKNPTKQKTHTYFLLSRKEKEKEKKEEIENKEKEKKEANRCGYRVLAHEGNYIKKLFCYKL